MAATPLRADVAAAGPCQGGGRRGQRLWRGRPGQDGSLPCRSLHVDAHVAAAEPAAAGQQAAAGSPRTPARQPCPPPASPAPHPRSDIGCHIDGYIAQAAHSLVVAADPAAPVTGRAADVVQCAQTCFDAAARLIRPGAAPRRLGAGARRRGWLAGRPAVRQLCGCCVAAAQRDRCRIQPCPSAPPTPQSARWLLSAHCKL